jgi:hypothetical protein
MIHEFTIEVVDETTDEELYVPCFIDMSCIESVRKSVTEPEELCVIVMKGGSNFITKGSLTDIVGIWKACVEKIDINNL